MRNYRKRVPFGEEKNLFHPGREHCEQCGCLRDEPHTPGCAGEECPACGKMLIGCCCEALSPHDGELIITGLYHQFNDLETALQAAGEEGCGAGGSSYLQHAVMRYIFENVPETVRSEIVQVFHWRFPGLVPMLQDEQGHGYYTAEQLAEALDIPLEEINERIEAMISAGREISTGKGRKLRKVH